MLFDGAYFLPSVMVEGDQSSRLRKANKTAVLAGYRPLLTTLCIVDILTSITAQKTFLVRC